MGLTINADDTVDGQLLLTGPEVPADLAEQDRCGGLRGAAAEHSHPATGRGDRLRGRQTLRHPDQLSQGAAEEFRHGKRETGPGRRPVPLHTAARSGEIRRKGSAAETAAAAGIPQVDVVRDLGDISRPGDRQTAADRRGRRTPAAPPPSDGAGRGRGRAGTDPSGPARRRAGARLTHRWPAPPGAPDLTTTTSRSHQAEPKGGSP